MWIKKPLHELKSELRVRLLKALLGTAFIVSVFYLAWFPHAGFSIPMAAKIGVGLAVVLMLVTFYRRAQWRRLHSSVRVCERCNVVKSVEDQAPCVCGGTFVPLREMKWLEMPPLDDNPLPESKLSPQHS